MKYEYCQCCKHSYDTGRKHIYTKEHSKKLSEWYNRQLERVNEVYQIAEELSTLVTSVTHSFWCAFCKKEIKDSGGFLVYWIFIDVNLDQLCFFVSSKNAFDHLGSKDHISRVYAFMKKNGSNYNQYKPESFIMDNDRYQKVCIQLSIESIVYVGLRDHQRERRRKEHLDLFRSPKANRHRTSCL